MANQTAVTASPHVVIFPLPFQGPVNVMLKLAELLCLHHIKVTFINTHHIQQRLFSCNNTEIYFRKYPNFHFETVPDGLPEDNPRTVDQFGNLMGSMKAITVPIFREMVTSRGVYGPDSGNPVTCIIADAFLSFAADIAQQIGVPLLTFDTISACTFWIYMCLPKLFEAGELPFKDDNLDEIITNLPGMEGIIRRRDLPSFCRARDIVDHQQQQLVLEEVDNIPLAHGLIFNTFQELEPAVLCQLLKINPNVYAIGPLHTVLKNKLAEKTGPENIHPIINSNSIWKQDWSCISWLDKQPPNSVLYFSIGSLSVMTKDQCFEIWHGLVNSGSRFLWVRRPDSISGLDLESQEIPLELTIGTKKRGCIVSWAPQEEVLSHSAIGGFLTHGGWNSVLESIVEGKPMICWPHYVDQHVNSRYVEEVWKIGLDMKDSCDRVVVENMIREIMDRRKDEFLKRGSEMARLIKSSVMNEGSSSVDFDRLIEDIKTMKIKTKIELV